MKQFWNNAGEQKKTLSLAILHPQLDVFCGSNSETDQANLIKCTYTPSQSKILSVSRGMLQS